MASPSKKHLITGVAIFIVLVLAVVWIILEILSDKNINYLENFTKSDKKTETSGLYVFFNHLSNNDCQEVLPVDRVIDTNDPEYLLKELLKGPKLNELEEGYRTALPSALIIQSISIADGVAHVDFNQALNKTAGSCAVSAIRSQIEQTLKQFDYIKEVVISVDGSTEEILQP